MPKFLIQATYTAEGARGLMRDGGSGRRAAVSKAVADVGGKLESFYFAFGHTDVFVIVEAPDATTVVSISLAINMSGAVHTTTTPLISCEEMDAACKKSVSYRFPGASA